MARFDKCKSNVKVNGEGRSEFKQENLIDHFVLYSHNGTHEDIKGQIIGHCDPNDQEVREDFWIFHLDTLHSQSLNQKRVLLNKLIQHFNEHFWFNSSGSHIEKYNCLNYYEHFYID